MVLADVVFPEHGERGIFAGAELSFKNLSLRAGYKDRSELEKVFSIGVGIKSKSWALDVAFSPAATEEVGNTYYMSFLISL
jgi:hypothetical protein